jgi:isoquinoline 1-oxidoreductase beta subunit
MDRRDFLQTSGAIGAALVIPIHFQSRAAPFAPNAWLRIGADDSVLVLVDRSEMGQGVTTSLPQLLAEELEADWTRIRFEFAPAERAYFNPLFGAQGTGGSTSVRAAWKPLREAGARARTVLIAAAAQAWGVEPASCRAERGVVIHAVSRRRLAYGRLVERAARLPVPTTVTLKDPKDWRIAGKALPRLDTRVKVNGTAQFGIDVRVPGMLTALIARSPVFGGTVKRFDAAAAQAVPGVRHVVQISSGVAVVADGYWPALQGRDALKVAWDEGPVAAVSSATIAQLFAERAQQAGAVARHDGDPEASLAGAAQKVEAVYQMPFLAHATMEPMNCTAQVRPDGVDIWAPTQFQTGAQGVGAQIGGVPPENVAVHTTYLGGGFGRRFELDFIIEAVETSKAVGGVPVKVVWTREDDMRHAQYRPANYHALRAGIDAAGKPVAWTHRVVAPSIMARVFPGTVQNGLDPEAVEGAMGVPYAVPNVHVDYVLTDTGVPVGFWRSVNNSFNAFAVETFIDELAAAARQDPYEYRRALLANAPRHRGVLELAATKAGWGTPLPAGRARGIAVHKSFESFVAQVAEVSVSAGAVRVHRVVCAVDCGLAVNPSTIAAQMQGGIVYGLAAALTGAITIDRGRVVESNFHDYPVLRLAEMPAVEVHLVASTEEPGGVGEPGTPPIAPAVCNAIFALTGKRIRSLPIGTLA